MSHLAPQGLRCLVIQLGSMTLSLQSLMALRAALQMYPDLHLTLLCDETFEWIARKTTWISEVIVCPQQAFLKAMVDEQKTPQSVVPLCAAWLNPVLHTPWEFIFNWSFTKSSSYLTALLPARIKYGFSRKQDYSFLAADGWSQYIEAVMGPHLKEHLHQEIHTIDILTTQILTALQIHLGNPASELLKIPPKDFFTLSINKSDLHRSLADVRKKWIYLQIPYDPNVTTGWSQHLWIQFLDHLFGVRKDLGVFIADTVFFTQATHEPPEWLAHYVSSSMLEKRMVLLSPKDSWDMHVVAMSRSYLVVSGSSENIALASVLGIKSVYRTEEALFFEQKAPYGNGHFIVLPGSGYDSHDAKTENTAGLSISIKDMAYVVLSAMGDRATQQKAFREGFEQDIQGFSAYVYRSKVRNASQGGGVQYEPLIKKEISLNDWVSYATGHIARLWYCGWLPPMQQDIHKKYISSKLLIALRELKESVPVLLRIFEKAIILTQTIQKKTAALKSDKVMDCDARQELRMLGEELIALEKLIERLACAQPPLKIFYHFVLVLMHNLQGASVQILGKEAEISYVQLLEGLQVYHDLVNQTLQLVRPTIVTTSEVG